MKIKIKNSAQSISPDISIVLMCLGILVACPLRIFQMLRNVDTVTGFYIDPESIMIIILYAVLGITALATMLLSYFSARIPASIAPGGKQIPLAGASFVFAATLFYDAVSKYFVPTQTTATIMQNAQTLSAIYHFRAITAFLASCYFIVFCISYFTGRHFHKKLKILSLMPLLWMIARVLERITIIISIVRISELLLELCAFIFMMMFFMSFARVVSEVNNDGSMWSVIGCGSAAVLFLMTYSIPRLILVVTGNTDSLVQGYPLNFADIGCILFVLFFVVTALRKGYSAEDVEKMKAEIKAEQEKEEKIKQNISNVQAIAESGAAEAATEEN